MTSSTQSVNIFAMIREHVEAFINIVWPRNCHICSRIINGQANAFDKYICTNCFADMKKTSMTSCQLCGTSLDKNTAHTRVLCAYCEKHPPDYQKFISCYQYEGAARKLIHEFKYKDRPYLAKTIIKLITNCLSEYTRDTFKMIDYLTAIPLHPARLREREFNQSQLIAQELSQQIQKPLIHALKKIKHTKSQTALNRIERFLNLKDSFAFNEKTCVKNKNILIIDDVVTTSATVREAASLLKKSGARNISVLTFAKGLIDENTA